MAVRIILFLVYVLLLLCFYWTFAQDASIKYGHPMMVALRKDKLEDERVVKLLAEYKRHIRIVFMIMLAAGLLLLLPVSFYIQTGAVLIFGFTGMLAPSAVARKYRKRLVKLKADNGWGTGVSMERHIDIKLDRGWNNKAMLSLIWYLFPAAGLIGVIWLECSLKGHFNLFSVLSGLSLVLMAASLIVIRWLPNRTYCDVTEKNRAANGNRKYGASLFVWILFTGDCGFNLCLLKYIETEGFQWLIFSAAVLCTACIELVFVLSGSYRRQQLILKDAVIYSYDEDDYWHYGLFGLSYNNPYDPNVFKENNSGGLNVSVNSARGAGKWIWACTAVFVVLIGAFLAWQLGYPRFLDMKGRLVDLSVENEQLIVESPVYHGKIPLNSLKQVSLMDALGSGSRKNGSSTAEYGAGSFHYDALGDVKLYAAFKHPPFIILETGRGIYVVNDDDPAATKRIYNILQAMLQRQGGEDENRDH